MRLPEHFSHFCLQFAWLHFLHCSCFSFSSGCLTVFNFLFCCSFCVWSAMHSSSISSYVLLGLCCISDVALPCASLLLCCVRSLLPPRLNRLWNPSFWPALPVVFPSFPFFSSPLLCSIAVAATHSFFHSFSWGACGFFECVVSVLSVRVAVTLPLCFLLWIHGSHMHTSMFAPHVFFVYFAADSSI